MIFRRFLAVGDIVAAAGALALLGLLFRGGFDPVMLVTIPLIVFLAKTMGRYDYDEVVLRKSTLEEFPALVMLAAGFALSWSLLAAVAGGYPHAGSGDAGLLWVFMVALLTACRTGARLLATAAAPHERVLIVGGAGARERLADALGTEPAARLKVVGFMALQDDPCAVGVGMSDSGREHELGFERLAVVVRDLRVDRVLLVCIDAGEEVMLEAVSRAAAAGVKVSIVPGLLEVVGSAVEFDTVGGVTVLGLRRPGLSRSSQAIKRGMDLFGASTGLIVLSPLLLFAAIAIRLDTRGPVFFRQARVGRDGSVFQMLKLRSMDDGADAQRATLQALNETDGLFKLRSDPRLTRVGRLLRRSSIDELPQLLNVLRGDMSLVGPRPLVIDEDRLIEGRHRSRLSLPPGMTGPWQVLGPTRPPLSEMVKTDYLYAANWTLWTDVKILLRTFAHVVARRGL